MNRKQFGILLVLLIVVGGAGWYLQKHRAGEADAGEQGTGQKLLGDSFPVNDIATISISQNTNTVTLEKRNDIWSVRERKDYPANFSTISEFLLKLRDLKVVQNEPIGQSQLGRLQLASPGQGTNSGTIVDLKDKDGKVIRSLTVGKKLMRKPQGQERQFGEFGTADGRYVMVSGNTGNALLVADPLNTVDGKADSWLDKEFFKIERPTAISVTFPVTSNSWSIVRDTLTSDWHFTDATNGDTLDQARASGVSSPFSSPSFNDILPAAGNESLMDKATTINVSTSDNINYIVKVGAKTNEDYPITVAATAKYPGERPVGKDEKPEDKKKADEIWKTWKDGMDAKLKDAKHCENWIYLVPSWSVDSLLKERKDLIAEKKEEPKSAETKSETAPAVSEPVFVPPSTNK